MKKRKSEEAVSPVIGVILMVVITVIIAAILAVFAFNIGGPEKAPQASIRIIATDVNGNMTTLEHYGGDPIRLYDIRLAIDQKNIAGIITSTATYNRAGNASAPEFRAGDKLTVRTNTTTNGITINSNVTGNDAIVNGFGMTTGGSLTVTVVHIPTNQVVSSPTVRT